MSFIFEVARNGVLLDVIQEIFSKTQVCLFVLVKNITALGVHD